MVGIGVPSQRFGCTFDDMVRLIFPLVGLQTLGFGACSGFDFYGNDVVLFHLEELDFCPAFVSGMKRLVIRTFQGLGDKVLGEVSLGGAVVLLY